LTQDTRPSVRMSILPSMGPCTGPDARSLMYKDRPWLRFYGKVPTTLAYPEVTLYEALAATARRVPEAVAWDFFGTRSTYAQLLAEVDRCAAALAAEGLREGDRFLISMPTSPVRGEFVVKRPPGCERAPDNAGAMHIE
jgi:non-ribosomal peptide synthetase component F